MNFAKMIGEVQRWAPVIEALRGMFGDPDVALEAIRAWELSQRAKNDARLERLKERDES